MRFGGSCGTEQGFRVPLADWSSGCRRPARGLDRMRRISDSMTVPEAGSWAERDRAGAGEQNPPEEDSRRIESLWCHGPNAAGHQHRALECWLPDSSLDCAIAATTLRTMAPRHPRPSQHDPAIPAWSVWLSPHCLVAELPADSLKRGRSPAIGRLRERQVEWDESFQAAEPIRTPEVPSCCIIKVYPLLQVICQKTTRTIPDSCHLM